MTSPNKYNAIVPTTSCPPFMIVESSKYFNGEIHLPTVITGQVVPTQPHRINLDDQGVGIDRGVTVETA